MMISPMYYTLTPNCYKVQFAYHPMMVKCIKRIGDTLLLVLVRLHKHVMRHLQRGHG